MSRGKTFHANGTGISSLLVHYGFIISHGKTLAFHIGFIFATFEANLGSPEFYKDISSPRPSNPNINDSSSYLDLSPLYGKNQQEQNQVRTFKEGKLKPDTFQDGRVLTVPPGVAVLLVMFNRFHNYAATTISAINENGRFTPPTHLPPDEKAAWRDEQIFQVSRLSVALLVVSLMELI